MNITYSTAQKSDANLLIGIYNASFYNDYIRYGECPAYGRSRESMEYSIAHSTKLIIICDNQPVGVISFDNKGNGKYYLGCLCVIPAYQGKGIGTQAFKYMLSVCPDWNMISLVTPADNKMNIDLYTKRCGCVIKGKRMDGNVEVVELCRNR